MKVVLTRSSPPCYAEKNGRKGLGLERDNQISSQREEAARQAPPIEPVSRARVLLVDDEPANLIAFEAVLSPLNVIVDTAASGLDALDLAARREYTLVLLDVMMPGLDGFETATRLRDLEAQRNTPLIFITASTPDRRRLSRGYGLGAVDYLFKPLDPEVLFAKVKVFVELRERREQMRRMWQELELRVAERTRELEAANRQLKREVAERLQAEDEAKRRARELARSNDELQRFAYVASHDLKEPLRMVSNYVQLLQRRHEAKLDTDAREYIRYAVEGVRRMYQLIDDLIDYAKVGRETVLVNLDLNRVVADALDNLKPTLEESKGEVDRDKLPELVGVRSNLVQLFQNLIGNAIKFHSDEAPLIQLRCEEAGEFFHFRIHDNGIGIDPVYADKIFELFQRLHGRDRYPGSGIGLAICKKIVEKHGGRIWFESKPGEGATFHFTLLKDGDPNSHPEPSNV